MANNFVKELSTARKMYNLAENTDFRKAYADGLSSATKQLTEALKEKDVSKKVSLLLSYEKTAQEYDFNVTANKEARRDTLSALSAIKDLWERAKDKETIVKHYANAHSGISKPTKTINDPVMDSLVKSQCRKLGVLANGITTPAEKAFYLKRQECLKTIAKEHKLQINMHLGLEKGEKDLGR